MAEPRLSVIVPVYKIKEAYLHQCIKSLMEQTFQDIEILLIDDGSPDHCGEICDAYAQKDSRITAVHQKNQGVSVARNTGMDAAHGTYLMFVDADDWIEPDCCERVLTVICEQDCDVVYFQRQTEDNIHNRTIRVSSGKSGRLSEADIQKIQLETLSTYTKAFDFVPYVPWAKIFRRDFLQKNACKYPIGIKKCQDVLFSLYYLEYLKKAYFFDYSGYHYRVNETSICQRYNPQILDILLGYLHEEEKFVSGGHKNDERYEKCLGISAIRIVKTLNVTLFFHTDCALPKKQYMEYMKQYYNDPVVKEYINKPSIYDWNCSKDKAVYWLLKKRCLHTYHLLYSVIYRMKNIMLKRRKRS